MSRVRGYLNAAISVKTGQGVLFPWRITDQLCLGKTAFSGIHELCEVFRSTAMSFQDLQWLQKLGSCKASFQAKVV